MIKPHIRIYDRRFSLHDAAQSAPGAVGIFSDQQTRHIRNVVGRTRQPILQGQEIATNVLGSARNEPQQPRQLPQHLHLAVAARSGALALAAQPLEPRDGADRLRAHVELADPRETTTSAADMQHTMASQRSRRAASAGNTSRTWSSRNSMAAITISACAMSSLQRSSAAASAPQSSALCSVSRRPGNSRRKYVFARRTPPRTGGCPWLR